MKLANNRPKRRCVLLFSLMALTLPIVNMSCKRTADKSANGNAANANSSVAAESTSSTPPFPTKEPERYQATWVTSGVLGGQSIPGLEALTNRQVPVARDGDKRRVETELMPGVKIVYLQLSNGRYVLYPAKKIYADVKIDGSDNPLASNQGVPSDFAPGKLINEMRTDAKYEKLGTEEINGRMTTKYRVTTSGDDDTKVASETIIWADESLGMPIKTESTSKDGSKFTMEMRDIKLEVDATVFELPKDYRKVEHSELLSSAVPTVKDILGIGDKNKKTKKQ